MRQTQFRNSSGAPVTAYHENRRIHVAWIGFAAALLAVLVSAVVFTLAERKRTAATYQFGFNAGYSASQRIMLDRADPEATTDLLKPCRAGMLCYCGNHVYVCTLEAAPHWKEDPARTQEIFGQSAHKPLEQ